MERTRAEILDSMLKNINKMIETAERFKKHIDEYLHKLK